MRMDERCVCVINRSDDLTHTRKTEKPFDAAAFDSTFFSPFHIRSFLFEFLFFLFILLLLLLLLNFFFFFFPYKQQLKWDWWPFKRCCRIPAMLSFEMGLNNRINVLYISLCWSYLLISFDVVFSSSKCY